jgi:hypothetical protein
VLPSTASPSASHTPGAAWSPGLEQLPAPKSWPTMGDTASTTPMKPMNTVM